MTWSIISVAPARGLILKVDAESCHRSRKILRRLLSNHLSNLERSKASGAISINTGSAINYAPNLVDSPVLECGPVGRTIHRSRERDRICIGGRDGSWVGEIQWICGAEEAVINSRLRLSSRNWGNVVRGEYT